MNIKNILIGIAIFILTSFVVVYGIQTFYPSPEYEDSCNLPKDYIPNTKEQCESEGGYWNKGIEKAIPESPETKPEINNGWCDLDYYCYQDYKSKIESYSKNIFIISLILGIIIIIIGVILFSPEFIGGGISAGGIFSLLYGTASYWRHAENEFKFIISLIGLIILVIFGYWINNKISKPIKKTKK